MEQQFDLICIGMALVDSIIKGFDPKPVSASGYRAESGSLIDCITPNEDEARYFTGKEEPAEMADVFLGHGVKSVIIKRGAEGCLYKSAEGALSLPAFDIHAVDATGAGDNFVAGFVSEILRGASHADALRFANACGAICTTAVGAGAALQSRSQVLRFMNDPHSDSPCDSLSTE